MITRRIVTGLALAGVSVFAFASLAAANTTSTASGTQNAILRSLRMKVEISASGQAQISGTVSAVSSNSLLVKSWGGVWNVTMSTSTVIAGQGGRATSSEIRVGDYVQIHGKVSETAQLTIAAKVIKDHSLVKKETKKEERKKDDDRKDEKRGIIQKVKDAIRKNGDKGKGENAIEISGTVICLPHRTPGEVQTMECAIGLQTVKGNFGLNYGGIHNLEVGKTIKVSGTAIKGDDDSTRKYNIVGTIKVQSISN